MPIFLHLDYSPLIQVALKEVSNGDITKWPANMDEAFICEMDSGDDCYISFQLDVLSLMTKIEIYSSMSSRCFPKILELEYSVIIYFSGLRHGVCPFFTLFVSIKNEKCSQEI